MSVNENFLKEFNSFVVFVQTFSSCCRSMCMFECVFQGWVMEKLNKFSQCRRWTRNKIKITQTFNKPNQEKNERKNQRLDSTQLYAFGWMCWLLKCELYKVWSVHILCVLRIIHRICGWNYLYFRYLTTSRANGWKISTHIHTCSLTFQNFLTLCRTSSTFAIIKPLWHFVFHQFELKVSKRQTFECIPFNVISTRQSETLLFMRTSYFGKNYKTEIQ